MKTFIPYRYLIFTMLLTLITSVVVAQDEESKQEKQKQAQEEMMKAMEAEEMHARKQMLEDQHEKMQHMEQEYATQAREYQRQARESSRTYSRSSGLDSDGGYYFVNTHSSGDQSQLTLRKSFRETSSESEGEFDVEAGISQFRCMISGSVRAGEIIIEIEYPDGKLFKELTINPSADVNFSKSISIKEGEEKKYTGSWYYSIEAEEAEGNYMVQIMTN